MWWNMMSYVCSQKGFTSISPFTILNGSVRTFWESVACTCFKLFKETTKHPHKNTSPPLAQWRWHAVMWSWCHFTYFLDWPEKIFHPCSILRQLHHERDTLQNSEHIFCSQQALTMLKAYGANDCYHFIYAVGWECVSLKRKNAKWVPSELPIQQDTTGGETCKNHAWTGNAWMLQLQTSDEMWFPGFRSLREYRQHESPLTLSLCINVSLTIHQPTN